ncbi:glutamate receptor ionotropic, kainate 3 [Trichonephila clavipes]|nr:glutamate receptor ionotropic, kainate 3 [Trichonephila clavipes]
MFPKKIRVAALNIPSVFKVNAVGDKIVADGADGKLLNCLAEKLNFEYEVVLTPDGQWGSRDKNGTWDGIVGLIQSGRADFGMPALGITEERNEDLDFSFPYTLLEKLFVTKEAGEMPKITAFTYPFTRNAWILYVLMTLAAAVLFQRIVFKNATLLGSFISVLGSIVSQAMENIRETPWRRILLALWLSIATIMPFLYNTNFLSFLTMPEKMPIPRTFEELSKAVLSGKFKCLTPIGTVDRELLRESNIDYLVKLVEIIEKNDWKYPFGKSFVDLLDGPIALMMPREGMDIVLGKPPSINVKSSLDNMGIRHVGIGLKKGFCCKEQLNSVMYGILSGGLYKKWFREQTFISTLHDRLNAKQDEEKLQLTLEDLKLAFFTLSIGYFLAFLAFLAEMLILKRLHIFYS